MRFDKLTLKAQEALQGAQELARRLGNPQIEPAHMLREPSWPRRTGLIRPLLKKLEVDPGSVIQGVDDQLTRCPGSAATPRSIFPPA
jgi:ATP-dependent Clp protease ATP-binding subunit ClpB